MKHFRIYIHHFMLVAEMASLSKWYIALRNKRVTTTKNVSNITYESQNGLTVHESMNSSFSFSGVNSSVTLDYFNWYIKLTRVHIELRYISSSSTANHTSQLNSYLIFITRKGNNNSVLCAVPGVFLIP